MLLHLAGLDVQEICTTVTETGDATNYASAVEALNPYFVPQVNSAFTRQTFYRITQNPGETVQQFVTRLRKAAKDCDFGTDTDNQIRDAVLNKGTSTYIKRKLLELNTHPRGCCKMQKDRNPTGCTFSKGEESESINRINERSNNSSTSMQGRFQGRDKVCYRCGLLGHLGHDPQCPARGKTCRNCRGKDHFEKVCKTKSYARQVGREPDDNDPGPQHDYLFSITEGVHSEMVTVRVGGVDL